MCRLREVHRRGRHHKILAQRRVVKSEDTPVLKTGGEYSSIAGASPAAPTKSLTR